MKCRNISIIAIVGPVSAACRKKSRERSVPWSRRGRWRGPDACLGGSTCAGRAMETFATLDLLQNDAVEQHGQLGRADLDTGWATVLSRGEAKNALFKSLIPQAPSILLPGQDLEAVASLVAEHEPVSRKRVIAQRLADEGAEPIETFAEVRRLCKGKYGSLGRGSA